MIWKEWGGRARVGARVGGGRARVGGARERERVGGREDLGHQHTARRGKYLGA